ncbi:hypothetical protein [Streptomyces eurythermus]
MEGVHVCADNQEVVDRSELVIIAVRRQDHHEALESVFCWCWGCGWGVWGWGGVGFCWGGVWW